MGEFPQRDRRFRMAYVDKARRLSAAGVTSNVQLARAFRVDEKSIRNWRQWVPAFDEAIEGGQLDAILDCADVVLTAARDGDAGMALKYLERVAPAFKPSSKLEHSGHIGGGETLAEHLERRAQTVDDLIRSGKLRYVEQIEDGDGEE